MVQLKEEIAEAGEVCEQALMLLRAMVNFDTDLVRHAFGACRAPFEQAVLSALLKTPNHRVRVKCVVILRDTFDGSVGGDDDLASMISLLFGLLPHSKNSV